MAIQKRGIFIRLSYTKSTIAKHDLLSQCMMQIGIRHIYIGIVVWIFGIIACTSSSSKYEQQIKTLDSTRVLLDTARMELKAGSTLILADSIEIYLNRIQADFSGDLGQEQAISLNRYALLQKDLESFGLHSQKLENRIDSVRQRIVTLRDALQEGATHDIDNNKLDKNYVQHQVKQELECAGDVLQQVTDAQQISRELMESYHRQQPIMDAWADSMLQKNWKEKP